MPTFEMASVNLPNSKIKPRRKVYAIPGVDYKKMIERMDAFEVSRNVNLNRPLEPSIEESQDISVLWREEDKDKASKHVSKRQKSKRLSDLFLSTATELDTDICDITSFLEHDTDLLTLARISDSE